MLLFCSWIFSGYFTGIPSSPGEASPRFRQNTIANLHTWFVRACWFSRLWTEEKSWTVYKSFRTKWLEGLLPHYTITCITKSCCWRPFRLAHQDKIFFTIHNMTKQSFTNLRIFLQILTSTVTNKVSFKLFLVFDGTRQRKGCSF